MNGNGNDWESFVDQQRGPVVNRGFSKTAYGRYRKVLEWYDKKAPGAINGKKVLDLGTCHGDFLDMLNQWGAVKTEGIDAIPEAVEYGKTKGRNVHVGDFRHLPYPNNHWDAVTMIHSLEHVPNPKDAIQEALRVLKPGGWLLIVVPRETKETSDATAHNAYFSDSKAFRGFMYDAGGIDVPSMQVNPVRLNGRSELRLSVRKHGMSQESNSDKGITYQLSGLHSAAILTTSLWSLRQHYDGPVTLFATATEPASEAERHGYPDTPWTIAQQIADDKRLGVNVEETWRLDDATRPHWVTKAYVYLQTPYRYTLYLDADTIILANPEPLLNGSPVYCTPVNNWPLMHSHRVCKAIVRQMGRFRDISQFGPSLPAMVNHAFHTNRLFINSGVFAYEKNHPAIYEIHHLCLGLRHYKMFDELAINIIAPHVQGLEHADPTWNQLAGYGDQWDEAKIVHCHYKTYHNTERGRKIYREHFERAYSANIAGMQEWAGRYNPLTPKLELQP